MDRTPSTPNAPVVGRRRRRVAVGIVAGLAGLVLLPSAATSARARGDGPPVRSFIDPGHRHGQVLDENAESGTDAWTSSELTAPKVNLTAEPPESAGRRNAPIVAAAEASAPAEPATPKPGAPALAAPAVWTDTAIRGYANQTSVNHGGPITFYVSTAQPSYTLDVYRMGWYKGAGARLMLSAGTLTGQNQPVPAPDPATGMVTAGWQPSYTLATGATWTSGVYLAKLTAADGSVGYITFVVRDDASTAAIVYSVPVTTYEAYNNWGGKSLYDFSSVDAIPAVKVSYDRPYTAWAGAGSFFDGDYNMIRWLESQGYDLTYTTSDDLHTTPAALNGHKVFLSPWHDEYWSREMRTNVTAARDRGMHLAWFGANNVYWQIRFEPSATGVANRVIVGYKEAPDPITATNPTLSTGTWRDPPVSQPENALLGVMYQSNFVYGTSFPWVVTNPTNWIYAGTGVKAGTKIPGLVGYEFDKTFANGKQPAGLVTLSRSPVVDGDGIAGTQQASVYTAASRAIVFSAGTIYWSWKLDDNVYQHHGADARVQRMTANILNRMLGTTPPPPTKPVLAVPIYTDALAPGWTDASWNATVNYANASPVLVGAASASLTVTAPWGGLYVRTAAPISTTGHTALSFAARSTSATQRYSVAVYGVNGSQLGQAAILTNYGGDPVSTTWTVYNVPFDADNLNVAGEAIAGIVIQDYSGGPQAALYIDQLGFSD